MDIGELYIRACFRFYRNKEQSGDYDTYAISRIFNYEKDDWDVLLLDSSMEGRKIFSNMEDLHKEYFVTGNYQSVMEIPFTEYSKVMLENIKNEGSWQYDEFTLEPKVSEVEVIAYKTSDGKSFISKTEALKHEKLLISTHYFELHYNSDLTDSGQMNNTAILKVVEPSKSNAIQLAEKWCYDMIGPRESYIGADIEITKWNLFEIRENEIKKNKRIHYVNKGFERSI